MQHSQIVICSAGPRDGGRRACVSIRIWVIDERAIRLVRAMRVKFTMHACACINILSKVLSTRTHSTHRSHAEAAGAAAISN
jgi:hypothetical protein